MKKTNTTCEHPELPPGYFYDETNTSTHAPFLDIRVKTDKYGDVLVAWTFDPDSLGYAGAYISTHHPSEGGRVLDAPTPQDALNIIVTRLWMGLGNERYEP